jgi:hypothetical protein
MVLVRLPRPSTHNVTCRGAMGAGVVVSDDTRRLLMQSQTQLVACIRQRAHHVSK